MAEPDILHATAVAVAGRAVLIQGASGSGKSSLALELMARGATLVADDRVIVTDADRDVLLSCPAPLQGMIEARGVGLLYADWTGPAVLSLVVDLDQMEPDRLPKNHHITILSKTVPLRYRVASPHFPAAVLQYLRNAAHPPI